MLRQVPIFKGLRVGKAEFQRQDFRVVLTAKIDGSLTRVVGGRERDVKVAPTGIDPSMSETSSNHFDALAAVVKILTQGMLERMG